MRAGRPYFADLRAATSGAVVRRTAPRLSASFATPILWVLMEMAGESSPTQQSWQRLLPKSDSANRFVVCTGGEPLLQLDHELIQALHLHGFQIAIETNGTLPVPEGLDWICVSPKAGAPLVVTKGNELKVVYPQETDPRPYTELDFAHFFIQPKDGPDANRSLQAAIQFCGDNPRWRLSLQTHKLIGIR